MPSVNKKKRIQDKKLLARYHEMDCEICGKYPSTPSHIRSKGAGGHDVESNLVALCVQCHVELHKLGHVTFGEKYPRYVEILEKKGWTTQLVRIA